MITLSNWRERMSEDLKLRDFRPRTQEGYLLSTRLFMDHVGKEPDALSDEDIRRYFLYLRDERKLSPSSITIALCALRFFFLHTLGRDSVVFELLRVKKPRTLPLVLNRVEVRAILGTVEHPVRRMALCAIYALGLRLGEGLALETEHIDAARLVVSVRDGKGGRDRTVPLPRPLLGRLRSYWKNDRPSSATKFLFVGNTGAPLHETTLQKTFTAAREDAALGKHATIHTLRHSYATHLLESGVSLRTIQQILGHGSLQTTEVYLHVTQPGVENVQRVLDRLMADL
jgi:site-specific recombinase XerD